MSDASQGGAPKKLSTAEILAAARKQATGGAAPPAAPAAAAEPAPAPAAEPAPEQVAAPAAPKAAPTGKPKSTADILAAARAQKAGGDAPASAPVNAAPAAAKPAAAPGAKPKSTADILAAARAGTKGAAAPAAPAVDGTSTPAAKPKPAAAAASETNGGPKLSVQEMLAAVRSTAAPGAIAEVKPAKPAGAPPMPAKPVLVAKAKKAEPDATRRNIVIALIVSPFALAWTLLTATAGVAGLAVARFMMPNVLTEPPRKFKIGPASDYDLGTVATKWVAQYGIWVVHTDQYKSKNVIYALASVCTHLGCTPSWLEGEQKFKCPCHGSGFYITGINFEGPAPRPLERVGLRLSEDGMLEVDKSLKFQEEMGQWNDPASFFEVVG